MDDSRLQVRQQERNGSQVPRQEKNDSCDGTEDDINAEDDDDNNYEEAPTVLQCKTCNCILGDSTAWVCANDDLKTVTLHSVTNAVVPGKKLMTSKDGTDLGSTYLQLLCKQCNVGIGRVYKMTSRQLDNLRDFYTFSVHKITSYQIGSREQTTNVDLQDVTLTKMQAFICSLNNRIRNIENCLQMEPDNPDEPGSPVTTGEAEDGNMGMGDRPEKGGNRNKHNDNKTTDSEGGCVDTSGVTKNSSRHKRPKDTQLAEGLHETKRSRFK